MLKKPHRTHKSSARFVGQPARLPERLLKKTLPPSRRIFTHNLIFGNYQKLTRQNADFQKPTLLDVIGIRQLTLKTAL